MSKFLVTAVALLLAVSSCSAGSDTNEAASRSTTTQAVTSTTSTSTTSTTAAVTTTTAPPTTAPPTTSPPTTSPPATAPPTAPPPVDPDAALAGAAAEAAASYDGGEAVGRSCSAWGPGDYECDFSTTAGNNLRIYVLVAGDGTYTWQWAGG